MTRAAQFQPWKHKMVSRESALIGRFFRICGWLFVVLLIGGVVFQFVDMDRPTELPPSSLLAEQMELAAMGDGPITHGFGGALSKDTWGDIISVTATEVPQEACVHTAWVLIGKGTIAINGVVPRRVTAAILAQLCGQHGNGSTVTWSLEKPKSRMFKNPNP